ncbi:MAG: glycosyltransferase family 2 protein [Bacteroidales bacterium]|nr:glycosyltransferase family 2 protein [Bacteroidales bacterium]
METLSVIIPVYNRASLICRTLDSVAAQTVLPQRLIVVDNDSSDTTRSVVEQWIESHRHLSGMRVDLLSERRPGAASARNRGLEEADTDWVLFFDSDDEMHPGHIERAMSTAARHPEADLIGWDVDIELSSGKRKLGKFVTSDLGWNNIVHSVLATIRYMARTSLFRKVEGWGNDVMVWDDWELGIRLLQQQPVVVKAKGSPTVSTYFTPDSLTGFVHHADRCLYALSKAESSLRRCKDTRLLRWLDYRKAVLAAECHSQGNKVAAKAILSQALEGRTLRERIAVRFTYLHTRLLKRGAYLTFGLLSH